MELFDFETVIAFLWVSSFIGLILMFQKNVTDSAFGLFDGKVKQT